MIEIPDPPSLEELKAIHGEHPPLSRELTDEERGQVPVRKKSRRIGAKGEAWARDRLCALGAVLTKDRDELKEYTDSATGKKHHYYLSRGLDYDGTIPFRVGVVPIVVEVKTFSDSLPLSSIKERQLALLNTARKQGKLALIVLVEHKGGTVVRGWMIPYRGKGDARGSAIRDVPDWADLVCALERAAERGGRFRGKSIRPENLDRQWEVEKKGGKWTTCAWLACLIGGEQLTLF